MFGIEQHKTEVDTDDDHEIEVKEVEDNDEMS